MCENSKKNISFFLGGGRVRGGGVGLGWGLGWGQGGWELRIEAFVKIQKKTIGGGGSGQGGSGQGGVGSGSGWMGTEN